LNLLFKVAEEIFIINLVKMDRLFDFLFKKFPAYFWEKPNVYKILLFPVLLYYYLKDNDWKKD